jgi:hypothetical protein
MTLKSVRPFARLVTAWCLEQDDLAGFHVEIRETPGRVLVILYWPDDWRNWTTFSLRELKSPAAPRAIVDVLETLAADARKRAARIADPGRQPG